MSKRHGRKGYAPKLKERGAAVLLAENLRARICNMEHRHYDLCKMIMKDYWSADDLEAMDLARAVLKTTKKVKS